MNILFVLYGDFSSNSANLLALYARELHLAGHQCVAAVPLNIETVSQHPHPSFRPVLYEEVLEKPESVFPDGCLANIIHAWTPREVVRLFVSRYLAAQPTPLLIYLEDNESWISCRTLGIEEDDLFQETEQSISEHLPDAFSHPFRYESFIGLADAVAVIQDKLKVEVPPWVHCETVMPGVDLVFFSPRPPDLSLRKKYGVLENEKVIVYHGGLNGFTKPGIEALCRAVGLINKKGYRCRLLRTGPFPLNFLDQLPPENALLVTDLGLLPKHELPDLLALSEVFVQPGKIDAFEDLRLPGKLPEFLAMGHPVIMPDVNIAPLFRDGLDAVFLHTGSAEEISEKCIRLFFHPKQAEMIGEAGRRMAEKYFDVHTQVHRLEILYKTTCNRFDPVIASELWKTQNGETTVASLLARKLSLLASLGKQKLAPEACAMMKQYSQYTVQMQQRVEGLEANLSKSRSLQEAPHSIFSQIGYPLKKGFTLLGGSGSFKKAWKTLLNFFA